MNDAANNDVPVSANETPARISCDVAVIGAGIAGLTLALNLPESLRVVVATKSVLGESNTRYAQGGLAAAFGPDDGPELHLQDTIAAGAGLVDGDAARVLVTEARDAVLWLVNTGTQFDRAVAQEQRESFQFDLTREAAHSRRRVLHARDATGAEVERALVEAVMARPNIRVLSQTAAHALTVQDGRCTGVQVETPVGLTDIGCRLGVVLANGGAGQLWLRTSNPAGATADGIALAWRAGAVLADLEFVQFHPTVLVPAEPGGEPFLISEAVRGEGAYLLNAKRERFMFRYHPHGELAPRDVVARAILNEMLATHSACAFLDLRHIAPEVTYERFPMIAEECARNELDLAHDLIPVAPAAHYFMGGVAVDTYGRTTVPGLFAVGEVACTGVHGANRLASNSLLEGLVFGRRIARLLADPDELPDWPLEPVLPGRWVYVSEISEQPADIGVTVSAAGRDRIRDVMWRHVSLLRDATGLDEAANTLADMARNAAVDPESANMLLAAQLIVASARSRQESRGGHFRVDYPDRDVRQDTMHSLCSNRTGAAPAAQQEEVERVAAVYR